MRPCMFAGMHEWRLTKASCSKLGRLALHMQRDRVALKQRCAVNRPNWIKTYPMPPVTKCAHGAAMARERMHTLPALMHSRASERPLISPLRPTFLHVIIEHRFFTFPHNPSPRLPHTAAPTQHPHEFRALSSPSAPNGIRAVGLDCVATNRPSSECRQLLDPCRD